jgi:23S rRNA (guanosine2251-2'-O)-methyltransferase
MRETLYGRNPVHECLRADRREVFKVILAQGARERGTLADIERLADRRGISVQRVDRQELDRLGKGVHHQGVIAKVSDYPYAGLEDMLVVAARHGEPPWLLLLDCLQDPQNLGTLLRTAEIVGVHGVILPERRAVAVTPAVVSASSGASQHLLIGQVTNLARTIQDLRGRDVWVYGLEDVQGASPLWQTDLRGAMALVVGSEGQGMRRLVRESCDVVVRLPMRGQVNSLNAAVAGSVALYEAARQRWK